VHTTSRRRSKNTTKAVADTWRAFVRKQEHTDAHDQGRFITLEGIEGAGKSTVARFARDWLAARGITTQLTREPGGTPLAERVRSLVLDRQGEAITPVTETLLMFAARALHVENLIKPAPRTRRVGHLRPLHRRDARVSRRGAA